MLRIPKFVRNSISGNVQLPVSKSMANRSLMIQALSGQTLPQLTNDLSNDVVVLHRALSGNETILDFEDAGTPLRFYLAYAALKGNGVKWIKGTDRLSERPVRDLLIALEQLGAVFEYQISPYQLPLRVVKTLDLTKNSVELDPSLSSQFVSALLLIAPEFENGLIINLKGEMRSEPYINMTIDLMRQSGVELLKTNKGFEVPSGKYNSTVLPLEGDWSSASFIYALLSLAGKADVFLENLSLDSSQGDKITAQIFESFGVQSTAEGNGIRLKKVPSRTDNYHMDFRQCPDLFPPVLAVCSALQIPAKFSGIKSLRLKESDRVEAMKVNLESMGYSLKIEDDVMELEVGKNLPLTVSDLYIKSFSDHRITMALTLMAFRNSVIIDEPSTVLKSFPDFWKVLENLFGVIPEEISE